MDYYINKILSYFFKDQKKDKKCIENYTEDLELNLKDNKIQIICKFTEEKCSLCHLEIEKNEKIIVNKGYKFHEECANYYSHINCKCCHDCSNAIVIN